MKTRLAVMIAVAAVLASGCSGGERLVIDDIPLPPEASETVLDGSYEAALDGATGSIVMELRETGDVPSEVILALPPDVSTEGIFSFYTSELDSDRFEMDGDPVSDRNADVGYWRAGDQTLAVAVIEAGTDAEGRPLMFLAVLLTP